MVSDVQRTVMDDDASLGCWMLLEMMPKAIGDTTSSQLGTTSALTVKGGTVAALPGRSQATRPYRIETSALPEKVEL